jgi:hypothetical protein
MSFSERVQELNQEIGATVERAVSDLRRQLTERLRANSEEILRQVEELAPSLPPHFLAHEHVAPFADEAGASARQNAFSELRDGLVGIDGARSQTAVLTALLGAAGRFASRSAVLLLRSGEVRGWGGHGFGDSANAADIRSLAFTAPADGAWEQVTQGHGAVRLAAAECADLCSRLESPLPQDGVLVPLILRDQLAALLYADSGTEGGNGQPLNVEALQTLTYVAAQAIELLPLRERASTATLRLAGQDGGDGAAATTPTAAVETAPEERQASMASPAAVEPAPAEPQPPESQPAQPEPPEEAPAAPQAAAEPTSAEPEPEPEPAWQGSATSEVRWPMPVPEPAEEEEAEQAAPASPAPPADDELEALPELPEVEATPAWEEEPEPWAAPEPEHLAPVPDEPAPAAPRPEETVLLQRPSFEPTPAPAFASAPEAEPSYPRPVAPIAAAPAGFEAPPAAPAEPERGGGIANPEVRPPSDVEGPGWAFATTRVPVSPDDAELHESARRLARLLVSEIKLYNEDQVEEGRRNRDLYERLKEDIDRSRQMYEERVEPKVWKSTDYFYQELVRILASGDSRALGI